MRMEIIKHGTQWTLEKIAKNIQSIIVVVGFTVAAAVWFMKFYTLPEKVAKLESDLSILQQQVVKLTVSVEGLEKDLDRLLRRSNTNRAR